MPVRKHWAPSAGQQTTRCSTFSAPWAPKQRWGCGGSTVHYSASGTLRLTLVGNSFGRPFFLVSMATVSIARSISGAWPCSHASQLLLSQRCTLVAVASLYLDALCSLYYLSLGQIIGSQHHRMVWVRRHL